MWQDNYSMTNDKTGYPIPELMQDDLRALSLWFATRLGARQQVKETLENLYNQHHSSGHRDNHTQ